jgi:hypothetical protein
MVYTSRYHQRMTVKRPYNVKIDPELIEALRTIKACDGITESEQIRRGIRLWLKSKGVRLEAERKRVATHRRPLG